MDNSTTWGIDLAAITLDGTMLGTWYPTPHLGDPGTDEELTTSLSVLERVGDARRAHTVVVTMTVDLQEAPASTEGAYLRLHLLSHHLVKPNMISLDSIFAVLPNVVWTDADLCAIADFEATRLRLCACDGHPVTVQDVGKFPPTVNYVLPSSVRVAGGTHVHLGAYLSGGAAVMHAGFVDFNADTLGRSMIGGRVSQSVVTGDSSDVGGGAPTIDTLSGGGKQRVRLGERHLLSANSGLGIALGGDCVVEAGLYMTAGAKVTPINSSGKAEPHTVAARELSGASNILFRRNPQMGRIRAIARASIVDIELNDALHVSNWAFSPTGPEPPRPHECGSLRPEYARRWR